MSTTGAPLKLSTSQLKYLIHHLVFPPKRPQGDDSSDANSHALLTFVQHAFQEFAVLLHEAKGGSLEFGEHADVGGTSDMLRALVNIMPEGFPEESALRRELLSLKHSDKTLAFYVAAQNVGVLLHRINDQVVFECYEVSPRSAAVMDSGRILRIFPGRAASIPIDKFDQLFINEFSQFLARMGREEYSESMIKTMKAGVENIEFRDTTDPQLVSQLLMAIIEANGQRIEPSTTIQKRMYDDVLWDSRRAPWRRSPLWTVARVSLQLTLKRAGNSDYIYKNFMLFLIVKLCKAAQTLDRELVYFACCKAARRCDKLGDDLVKFLFPDSVMEITDRIKRQRIECAPSFPLLAPSADDAILKLSSSSAYIQAILESSRNSDSSETFCPPISRSQFSSDSLPDLTYDTDLEKDLVLTDMEMWVESSLEAWEGSNKGETACATLSNLLLKYISIAPSHYALHPELVSRTLLVTMELWCAVDRLALTVHPMLREYSPEIPAELLEPLLLPKLEQLERLQRVEQHLRKRYACSNQYGRPSIFSQPQPDSFTTRFFATSITHRLLKEQILTSAQTAREAKKKELSAKNDEHVRKKAEMERLSCTFYQDEEGDYRHPYCRRCNLQSEISRMTISIHEWPLPACVSTMETVVVEAECPTAFRYWRDCTVSILQDLGRKDHVNRASGVEHTLFDYSELSGFVRLDGQRVTLSSTAKTFARTHYNPAKIPANERDVLKLCSLKCDVYDTKTQSWPVKQESSLTFENYCRTKITESYYKPLQWTVNSIEHTQNSVLARQAEASEILKLNEFIAFGSVRSGAQIQLYNLIRELDGANMSFETDSVRKLFLQSLWQAGPAGVDTCRLTHAPFNDKDFCQSAVTICTRLLTRIEANWTFIHALCLVSSVLLRVISLARADQIVANSIEALIHVRDVALGWLDNILQTLLKTEELESISSLQHQLIHVAAVCRATYDVERRHLPSCFRPSHLPCYIRCGIIIQDNHQGSLNGLPSFLAISLIRDRQIARRFHQHVLHICQTERTWLDNGIQSAWENFKPSEASSWSLHKSQDRWMRTVSAGPQEVQFNLLESILLVDGKRLGRLPPVYVRHPTYARIFGSQILEVSTSSMSGLTYMTTSRMDGYEVFLTMHGQELCVRTRKENTVHELIPHEQFRGDLPRPFVDHYTHWLDIKSGLVELRALGGLGRTSGENWHIQFADQSVMRQGSMRLLDISSDSFSNLTAAIERVEKTEYVYATVSDKGLFKVFLPRMNLHFILEADHKLFSPELKANIAFDQTLGTLIGLQNKLLLKDLRTQSETLLIPFGAISTTLQGSFASVLIENGYRKSVEYFLYKIDPILQRLRGTPALLDNYYLAYLHALTSDLCPDSFTGMSGTETALSLLGQSFMFPTEPLSESEQAQLALLAKLTPEREYYPKHKKCMQIVGWDSNLPVLSQDLRFAALSYGILQAHEDLLCFHDQPSLAARSPVGEGSVSETVFQHRKGMLQDRAHAHTFKFWSLTLECQPFLPRDVPYQGREMSTLTTSFRKASEIANFIQKPLSVYDVEVDLWGTLQRWNVPLRIDELFKPTCLVEVLEVEVKGHWDKLLQTCRNLNVTDHNWELTFVFATIAFGKGESNSTRNIRTLLSFAVEDQLAQLDPPVEQPFQLSDGCGLQRDYISNTVRCKAQKGMTRDDDFAQKLKGLIHVIFSQAHKDNIIIVASQYTRWFKVGDIEGSLWGKVQSCSRNRRLKSYLRECEQHLETIHHPASDRAVQDFHGYMPAFDSPREAVSAVQRLFTQDPPSLPSPTTTMSLSRLNSCAAPQSYSHLQPLIQEFVKSSNHLQRTYGADLEQSSRVWRDSMTVEPPLPSLDLLKSGLIHDLSSRLEHAQSISRIIKTALSPNSTSNALLSIGLWPKITPFTLLRYLTACPENWRSTLIAYGKALVELQRASRMKQLLLRNEFGRLKKELMEAPFEDWHAAEFLPWLLFQIDNDLTIRGIQARVARNMISPPEGRNSVMQLNMGEGKSAVIIPIVAATLAEDDCLARVVVLKPLRRQMTYVLKQSLGGLLNRRIYFFPFSRNTALDEAMLSQLKKSYEDCKASGGILLTQPEYIQSFKLIAIDKAAQSRDLARKIWDVQDWSRSYCRDILDESDEILDVRSQLIYTMGTQAIIDGGISRWSIIQKVLGMVSKHAKSIYAKFPKKMDILDCATGGFVGCRFFDGAAAQHLIDTIVDDISCGGLPELKLKLIPELEPQAIRFIKERKIDDEEFAAAKAIFSAQDLFDKLLILRGLIAYGVLAFTLSKKRYRVEYGLDLSRSLMAVPFRAKDVPTVNAEFGHQDVALILTCLSYYYSGLDDEQITLCFQALFKDPDPPNEYEFWVERLDIPHELRQLQSINLDDSALSARLFDFLRIAKPVIDYFLSHVVFPRAAREFPNKLSSSGWDIPSENELRPTTGFSGTNDSRFVLPLSIKQITIPELESTNAMVLGYLLQKENDNYSCFVAKKSVDLLAYIANMAFEIQCLFDAGAQVLDLHNREVAIAWLRLSDVKFKAALYIDEKTDEKMIIYRYGRVEKFMYSSYRDGLENCLVYLDQMRTRGTDLPLPPTAKAAVTLGPRLSKDRLLQACMRLRKLGQGQSVVFVAPLEVDTQIRTLMTGSTKSVSPEPGSLEVLRWSMAQTCSLLTESFPLWEQQGLNHRHRQRKGDVTGVLLRYNESQFEAYRASVLEPEVIELEALYGAGGKPACDESEKDEVLVQIKTRAGMYGGDSLTARLQEEQEREVEQEREQERQVERPSRVDPAPQTVSPALQGLLGDGVFVTDSSILSAEEALTYLFGENFTFPTGILVTRGFSRSVLVTGNVSQYVRPVNWVVSTSQGKLIVVSPHEVESLITQFRTSRYARLHMYAPRVRKLAPPSFEDLTFFSITGMEGSTSTDLPRPELLAQLALFAGQLYFLNKREYFNIRSLLLRWTGSSSHIQSNASSESVQGAEDSKIKSNSRCRDTSKANQDQSINAESYNSEALYRISAEHLNYARRILTMQCRGSDFSKTHMGRIIEEEEEDDEEGTAGSMEIVLR